jgi:hypothetical protein
LPYTLKEEEEEEEEEEDDDDDDDDDHHHHHHHQRRRTHTHIETHTFTCIQESTQRTCLVHFRT